MNFECHCFEASLAALALGSEGEKSSNNQGKGLSFNINKFDKKVLSPCSGLAIGLSEEDMKMKDGQFLSSRSLESAITCKFGKISLFSINHFIPDGMQGLKWVT